MSGNPGMLLVFALALSMQSDWPQFRGPNASGVSEATNLPVSFGPGDNVLWKTPVPMGNSSPVVAGDRVYLTGVEQERLLTVAVDRRTEGLGHAAFVDRVGDTFRWKSENVSTLEVEQAILSCRNVGAAAVYGVKVSGSCRAGMAALVQAPGSEPFDAAAFAAEILEKLPLYAVPIFLRLTGSIELTSMHKQRKGALKQEGFDVRLVHDPLLVMLPGSREYVPLTPEIFEDIGRGAYPF